MDKTVLIVSVALAGATVVSSMGTSLDGLIRVTAESAAPDTPREMAAIAGVGSSSQTALLIPSLLRKARTLETAQEVARRGFSGVITNAADAGRALPTSGWSPSVIHLPEFDAGEAVVRGASLIVEKNDNVWLASENNILLARFTNSPQLAASLGQHFGPSAKGRTRLSGYATVPTAFETVGADGRGVRTSFSGPDFNGNFGNYSEEVFASGGQATQERTLLKRSFSHDGHFLAGRANEQWLQETGIYQPAVGAKPERFNLQIAGMDQAIVAEGVDAKWLAWLFERGRTFSFRPDGTVELRSQSIDFLPVSRALFPDSPELHLASKTWLDDEGNSLTFKTTRDGLTVRATIDGVRVSLPAGPEAFGVLDLLSDGPPARFSLVDGALQASRSQTDYAGRQTTRTLSMYPDGTYGAQRVFRDGDHIAHDELLFDARGQQTYARFTGSTPSERKVGTEGIEVAGDGARSSIAHADYPGELFAFDARQLPQPNAWQRFWNPLTPIERLGQELRWARSVEIRADRVTFVDRRGRTRTLDTQGNTL